MTDQLDKPIHNQIDAKRYLTNGGLYTEDWKISAQNQSFLQRGPYTLSNGSAGITLPRPYLSAKNSQNLAFIITSQTSNHAFYNGMMSATTFGVATVSSISGFYISGSGTDSGYWLTVGYK